MKSLIVAFACIALAAADVSHLNLNREYLPPDHNQQQHHHHEQHHEQHAHHEQHGHHAGAASSVSLSASNYNAPAAFEGRIAEDVQQHYQQQQQQSQDIPDSYAPLSNDISVDVPVPFEPEHHQPQRIGADTITPAHLLEPEQEQRIPGDSSDSYTPAHLLEQEQRRPGDSSDSYTPAHLLEQEQRRPGDSSESYTPAHLLEQEQEQRRPGDSSDSYTPAHLLESGDLRFGAVAQQSAHVEHAASGIDTQYGANGGYVY